MIKVEHLKKYYGDFLAVNDLSFEIGEGSVYGFLGPNGAGKSTTMNIITGCLSPTEGKVSVAGFDILEEPLQPLLQAPALQPAFDNVVPALFGAMAYKYFRRNMDIAILPLIVMSLLFTLVPTLISSTSFMILPSGALAIFLAWRKFRKTGQEAEV